MGLKKAPSVKESEKMQPVRPCGVERRDEARQESHAEETSGNSFSQ